MVFDYYKLNEVFAKLRELIDTDYYEKLVEKYFLNNPHKVLITVAPEQGLIGKEEKALKDKLLAYQNGLTDEEKQEQAVLRREYIEGYKRSLMSQLDNMYIVEPDGTKKKVTPKQ